MGKTPGKWIKSLLLGKKSSKSNLKGRDILKSANREESLITSKVSVSESFTTPPLTEPPALEISAPIAVDLQHGVAAALLNDAVNQSSTKEDGDALMTTNLSSQEVPDRIRHEEAATKAQAAFRGYLARRAFRTLKGIIRLQAVIRGHLVRRQAVITLRCLLGIVKFQALARGQRVRYSDIGIQVQKICSSGKFQGANCSLSGVNSSTSLVKLSKNAVIRKLLASSPSDKPLCLRYDPGEPNSAWLWLERWMKSRFFQHKQKHPATAPAKARARQPADTMPGPLRATRGVEFRQQPTKRFGLNVRTRLHDGTALARGERVGTSQQGYLGPVIEGRVPYITTTSRADLMSAFNKRCNYHTDARMDSVCRAISRGMIRKLVPQPMPTIEWDVELYRDWLALFDTEKQQRMETAYQQWGLESLSGYTNKGIFTKIECLVKEFHEVAPRVIFKGTDVYNMISGPMFKALMDRFVLLGDQLENLKFRVSYRQHTPEIVEFLEGGPTKSFLEADFSSNDKTQVKDVQELECMFIRRLGAPKWFVDLHRKSNKFSVHNSKYGLSAIVENQLPSGATDGTFRNSFWNLCIFNCWSRLYKVPPARVVLLGDDILAGLAKRVRRSSRHYTAVASRCRMTAKVTTHRRLSDAHFLSKHFYPVCRGENGHVMMPFIGKILAKFNARPNSNEGVSDDEYMAGKALSHCYEFRYCHKLRDMFRDRANLHLQRSGGRFSVEGVTWHVRVHSAYADEIEQMLLGSMEWEDLVTAEDLTSFWLDHWDLTYVDVEPTLKAVILEDSYRVLDHVAAKQLGDF